LRDDDAAFGDHRWFADLLGVAELVAHHAVSLSFTCL
jgi:hypothetical protein